MGRSPCCEKAHTNKGAWTKEEDQRLINYIRAHGEGCWRSLPKAAGLLRCGKSCRLRWINYLRPDLKRGNFTEEEDELIIKLHSLLGNKWSLIAGRLPGRTDNEIKNYWNTHIKRKLLSRGLDPQTHRPINSNNNNSSSNNNNNNNNNNDFSPNNNEHMNVVANIKNEGLWANYALIKSDCAANSIEEANSQSASGSGTTEEDQQQQQRQGEDLQQRFEKQEELNLDLSISLPFNQSQDSSNTAESKQQIHRLCFQGFNSTTQFDLQQQQQQQQVHSICMCYNLGFQGSEACGCKAMKNRAASETTTFFVGDGFNYRYYRPLDA
ncbi:hypothetical protein Syun_003065 [Stephania yunnanensis]|uniref:Uncharacterized protein n=1 Tax=Stephania yunnanensis TaxID=152371 RepID=A0AAP0L0I7_9MAGN